MRNYIKTFLATGLLVTTLALSHPAVAAKSSEDDARIKTLVYNDNEVFRVQMQNGFQTDIELGADETIDTLSVGDSIGWQITPASHRIFIKPLQKTGVTNLSVITNRRTYQFELVATSPTRATLDHAYVVRFYYPDSGDANAAIDRSRGSMRPVSNTSIPEFPTPGTNAIGAPATPMTPPVLPGDAPTPPVAPTAAASLPVAPTAPMTPPVMPGEVKSAPIPGNVIASSVDGYNFNYTLSGPDSLAPTKIYDDGRSTFFQFSAPVSPAVNFAKVNPDGTETQLPSRPDAEGKIIVDQVASKFTIRDGGNLVCIFNEQASPSLPVPSPTVRP